MTGRRQQQAASRLTLGVLLVAVLTSCGTHGAEVATPAPSTGPSIGPSNAPAAPTTSSTPASASGAPLELPTEVPAAQGEVTTGRPVTVLTRGDHPAELCVGAVADSLPPQCGGPVLVGWQWAEHVGGFQQRAGVRWGDFLVTGHFDGTSVTPSSVVAADEVPAAAPSDPVDFSSPCPTPSGGWQVVDPGLATRAAFDRTVTAASALDGYAGLWVDQSINPASARDGAGQEAQLNDPAKEVLDVQVTGDTTAAESTLRRTWGGALCVSRAQHSDAELASIQSACSQVPGFLGSSHGFDHVELEVTYDDGTIKRALDAAYGVGVVQVTSALVPVAPRSAAG